MKFSLIIVCLLFLISCKEEIKGPILKWEGAASRTVDKRALILVSSIESLPEKISPSVAGYMPNPVMMFGKVIASDVYAENQHLSLLLPSYVLNGISINSTVVLGFFNNIAVICVEGANENEWEKSCISKNNQPIIDLNFN